MRVIVREWDAGNETFCTKAPVATIQDLIHRIQVTYRDSGISSLTVSVECEECAHILSEFDIDLELLRGALTTENSPGP